MCTNTTYWLDLAQLCVCVVWVHLLVHMCVYQRATCRGWVSPSTAWVLGIELRSGFLVAVAFIHWTILPAPLFAFRPDLQERIHLSMSSPSPQSLIVCGDCLAPERQGLRWVPHPRRLCFYSPPLPWFVPFFLLITPLTPSKSYWALTFSFSSVMALCVADVCVPFDLSCFLPVYFRNSIIRISEGRKS